MFLGCDLFIREGCEAGVAVDSAAGSVSVVVGADVATIVVGVAPVVGPAVDVGPVVVALAVTGLVAVGDPDNKPAMEANPKPDVELRLALPLVVVDPECTVGSSLSE